MTKERGLKEAYRVAPTAKTVTTMKMPAATLHMACNRMVASAEKLTKMVVLKETASYEDEATAQDAVEPMKLKENNGNDH